MAKDATDTRQSYFVLGKTMDACNNELRALLTQVASCHQWGCHCSKRLTEETIQKWFLNGQMMILAAKAREKTACCVFFERCPLCLPWRTACCMLRPHRLPLSIGPRCPLADVRKQLWPCLSAMAAAMLHHAYRSAMRIQLSLIKDTHSHRCALNRLWPC